MIRRALLTASALAGTVLPAAAETHHMVYQGLDVTLAVESLAEPDGRLLAGVPIRVALDVRDALAKGALSDLDPAAWLRFSGPGESSDGEACERWAEVFLSGSLLSQPEAELNAYAILTLNEDASISVLDPLFGLGGNRLSARIPLPGPGEDWALSDDGSRLFVTVPTRDNVVVIDTDRRRVVDTLEVCDEPRRAALQPDGGYLWVGCDGGSPDSRGGVSVVDPARAAVVSYIETGAGAHDFAFSADSRFVFVTHPAAGALSVLDSRTLEPAGRLSLGGRPASVAYSDLAQAAYVVDGETGTVVVVDGRRPEVRARIGVGPGLGEIRFAPGGRLGFIVDPEHDRLHILDAAADRVIQSAAMEARPFRVSFSDEMAYVQHLGSESVLMVPLDAVGREDARVPVIDFPGGQHAFGGEASLAAADGIVQVPGASAVLVANPLDQAVYFYKEGMAAPMGEFPNGGRRPRAVLAVDRSLRERTPGHYETSVLVASPGPYELVLYLDSPRLVRCFDLEVEPPAEAANEPPGAPSVDVEALAPPAGLAVGDAVGLRFRLRDSETGELLSGLDDVSVLTFRAPGRGRLRLPAEAAGNGEYVARFTASRAGVHYFFVECPSRGLRAGSRPQLVLEARPRRGDEGRPPIPPSRPGSDRPVRPARPGPG